jgi:hypothetical protein
MAAPTAGGRFDLRRADQPIGREIEALGNDQKLPGRA